MGQKCTSRYGTKNKSVYQGIAPNAKKKYGAKFKTVYQAITPNDPIAKLREEQTSHGKKEVSNSQGNSVLKVDSTNVTGVEKLPLYLNSSQFFEREKRNVQGPGLILFRFISTSKQVIH